MCVVQVSYVKHVKTWRMLLFTGLQALGLIVLWIVKSTAAALAFPFFVVAMIPYRYLLKFLFTDFELEMVCTYILFWLQFLPFYPVATS